MCSLFRAVRRASRAERVPRIMVHLCLQVLDPILVNHPYQVSL